MIDRVVIERLEFEGFVGITESERTALQPLAVDLELAFDMAKALSTDDLKNTVDYGTVAQKIVGIAKTEQYSLIENLADRLACEILMDPRISELSLWIRKLRPPLNLLVGSVGTRIIRRQESRRHPQGDSPASWLIEHRNLLRQGRALDLASGEGRHAIYLAEEGFRVDAYDRAQESLDVLTAKAKELDLSTITTRLVDLEKNPELPQDTYDVLVVFYYLQRDLIPHIIKALAPGGIIVYETFLIDNHQRFDHPRRKEFCLQHNELLSLFSGLRTLAYREGSIDPQHGPFIASLVAQRPL